MVFEAPEEEKDTYIALGEALAPTLAIKFHPNEFRDTLPIFHIDNMSVLSALVLGNSKVIDLSIPTYTAALYAIKLRCCPWWEHVESAANVADGGSRVGVSCPVAKRLGITLQWQSWPVSQSGAPMTIQQLKEEIIGELFV